MRVGGDGGGRVTDVAEPGCERSIHAPPPHLSDFVNNLLDRESDLTQRRQGFSGSFGLNCIVRNRSETKPSIILNDFGLGDLFLF